MISVRFVCNIRYQPQDGYSSVQPNEFSYTGVGYGGYDANASSYDVRFERSCEKHKFDHTVLC